MGSSSSTGEVNRADEMNQQELVKTLQQSIKGLNSEFDNNHQAVTDEIKKLKDIPDEETTVRRLVKAKKITEPMIEHLGTIYNTVEKLQKKKKDYDQNKDIMTRVISVNMEIINKPLELHQQLNGKIYDLIQMCDHNKITRQNNSLKLMIKETADKFQETLIEIKHAKEYIKMS